MLNPKERQALKAKAHALKPVVMVGQKGITEAVLAEIEIALAYHELIKIKLAGMDKSAGSSAADHICEACSAEHVQSLGQVHTFYRKRQDTK